MKKMSAKGAKNSFGLLLDLARAAPVQVEVQGRQVVVAISVEKFQPLNAPPKRPGKLAPGTVTIGN